MQITAEGWGWRYATRKAWSLRNLDFTIESGERVLLLGASGSGKSTLLAALAGVLDDGEEAGKLLIDGKHPTRMKGQVGLVQQNPESQLILERVGDDVAFGLENLAVPREKIWPLVHQALEQVRLDVPLDHSTGKLSGGQQQRLAIASSLAMQQVSDRPGLLLLDEPTANLDPEGVTEVRDTIRDVLARTQTTLIVVEHRVSVWSELVDRVIVIGEDGLLADGNPAEVFSSQGETLAAAGCWVPGVPHGLSLDPGSTISSANPILTTQNLAIGYDFPIQDGLNLQISQGSSTVITGENGAGKTTLALTLAGLHRALGGEVLAEPQLAAGVKIRKREPRNPINWTARELLPRIGTVFQHPEHQFVENTVEKELAVGLVASKKSPAEITARVTELAEALRLTKLLKASPYTLSGGEQRRLSVAGVLATNPKLIFLDEPTFGQDRRTWISLIEIIKGLLASGTSVVSVTHDPEFISLLGEHRIHLERQ